MAVPAEKHDHYTWADYLTWPDDERWEIIGGLAFAMSPAPSTAHQILGANLTYQLMRFFDGKPCQLMGAPCDVKLSDHDIVQPDLLVVCNLKQIQPGHIAGPPTLVVEILSPSSHRHDGIRKLNLYARAGVPEYWVIDPAPQTIQVLQLDGTQYRLHGTFAADCEPAFSSPRFPGLTIDLAKMFTLPPSPAGDEVRDATTPYATRLPRPPPPRASHAVN